MGSAAIKVRNHGIMTGAVGLTQGKRATDEDNYTLLEPLPSHSNITLSAVFDGHGGSAASALLPEILKRRIDACIDPMNEAQLQRAFLDADAELILRLGKSAEYTGTTATVVLIKVLERQPDDPESLHRIGFCMASVGDSPAAILWGGYATEETVDHKPYDKAEFLRIRRANGTVDVSLGNWEDYMTSIRLASAFNEEPYLSRRDGARVCENLNMSRSFGDSSLKCYEEYEPSYSDRYYYGSTYFTKGHKLLWSRMTLQPDPSLSVDSDSAGLQLDPEMRKLDPTRFKLTAVPSFISYEEEIDLADCVPNLPTNIAICSDGVVERLHRTDVWRAVGEGARISSRQAVKSILGKTIAAGTWDNTTAIVIGFRYNKLMTGSESESGTESEYLRTSPDTLAEVDAERHMWRYHYHEDPADTFYKAYLAHAKRHGAGDGLTRLNATDRVLVHIMPVPYLKGSDPEMLVQTVITPHAFAV
jgi:serine/threonine protein phosphatase PrpC